MMDGMDNLEKIDLHSLETGTAPGASAQTEPMRRRRKMKISSKAKKRIGILIGVLIVFLAFAIFGIVLPAQRVYKSAQHTQAQAKIAYEALKQQNIEVASEEIKKTRQSLTQTQKDLHAMGYMKFIPIANMYYNDADHLMNAGFHGLDAAEIIVDSIEPYADVLGLKGQGSFVMGSAEQRIQTAVMTMGKITPRIDEVADALQKAQKEIDQVDPNHYPPVFGGEKVHTQLTQLRIVADQGITFVDEARPLIKVLPSLLGESEPKRYLVLFQNDKELRPTGGFITAYAVFKVDKGNITVERSEDIYKLDDSIRNKPKAPAPILKYFPKVTTLNLRDSNLSPDFVTSMEQFRELYERASEKVEVDGIIALDTHVLVSVIKVLDDKVEAGGITFTSQNDKRCDCPQAIYALEDNISRPVGYIRAERKALLGQLLSAIMQKSLTSSPKLYWGPLFQTVINETNQKHILFYIFDDNAQKGIESLNAAGRIKDFEGDYFHISSANFSGAKTNLYIQQAVTQDMKVENNGEVTKTVTIKYKNPHPPSDCNLERGGLCLNALHREWFRIYVPKGSTLIDSKGSEVKLTTYEEFGKTVFDGFLTVRPNGGETTLTVTYRLPFKVANGSPLPLLIQKQPGIAGASYMVIMNGKEVEQFDLIADKELTIKL